MKVLYTSDFTTGWVKSHTEYDVLSTKTTGKIKTDSHVLCTDRKPSPTVKLNHYCFELTGLTFFMPVLRKWKCPVFQRDIKAVVFMFECENTGLVDHCRPKGNVSFLLTFRKTATVQKSMVHHSWIDWWCLRGWLLFLSNLRTFVEKRSVQAIAE